MAENQDDRPPRNTPRKTHVRRFWRYEGGGWTPRGYNKGEKDEDVWVDVQRIDEISTKSGQGERYQITKIKLNWYDSDGVTENTTRATSMAKVRNPDDPDTFIEVPLIDKSRIRERGVIYDRETKRQTLGPQHRNFVIRNETDELPLTEDTTRQVKRRKVINREIINDMEPDEDGFFSEPYVYKNISDPGTEDEDQRAIVEQIDRAKMNWGMGGPSGQETQGLSGVTDILRQEYLEEVTRDLEDNVDQKAAPVRLDAFQNIVNVSWDGAIEPQLNSAITQFNSQVPNTRALTISGWIRVRSGIPLFGEPGGAIYTAMTFGGYPDKDEIGYSELQLICSEDGFLARLTLVGTPSAAEGDGTSTPFSRAGYDDAGWFVEGPVLGQNQIGETLTRVPNPVPISPPIIDADGRWLYWRTFGFYNAVCAGDKVPPITGCFQVPFDDSSMASSITLTANVDPLSYDEWHHFMWAIDTGGAEPWGGDSIEAYAFANAEPNLDLYFLGEFPRVATSLRGLAEVFDVDGPPGVNINKGTFGIPRPSTELGDWLVSDHVQYADWQFYPRMINPGSEIGNFMRIQKGERKRVRTRVAEELYGFRSGSPPRKRAMWLFKGGQGSFHKSGNRAWGGNFTKKTKIISVPPPKVART